MRRFVVLTCAAATALLASAQFGGASGGNTTLRTFAGGWSGHDRSLTITRTGWATETLFANCCQRDVTLHFRITKVWGTAQRPLARARVIYVHVYDPSAFSKKYPPPRVGEVGTLRIVKGVLYEPMGGDTYCNGKTVAVGKCGA